MSKPSFRASKLTSGEYAMSASWRYATEEATLAEAMEVGFFPKDVMYKGDLGFLIASDGAALVYVRELTDTQFPVLALMTAAPAVDPARSPIRKAA